MVDPADIAAAEAAGDAAATIVGMMIGVEAAEVSST